jgi:hypothetical protein
MGRRTQQLPDLHDGAVGAQALVDRVLLAVVIHVDGLLVHGRGAVQRISPESHCSDTTV